MVQRSSYLLIDFSNLAYASFFKTIAEARIQPDKIPLFYKDHVKHFNDRIQKIRQHHGLADLVYALDRRPVHKYDIYPDYKKGRGKLMCEDGSFYDVKKPCLEDLEIQGATVIYAEDHEADDAIASFVAQHFDNDITVVSSDKDLWIVLDHPNVKILNFLKSEYITKQHLREAFCIKDKYGVIQKYLTEYSQIKLWNI